MSGVFRSLTRDRGPYPKTERRWYILEVKIHTQNSSDNILYSPVAYDF